MPVPKNVYVAVAFVVPLAMIAACRGDGSTSRSPEAYCTAVGDHLSVLNDPDLSSEDAIEETLDAWNEVADVAPLAVQSEWDTVIEAMETAATVDPNDPGSVQQVADTARAAEPAANRLINYTYDLCRAVIGPVTPVTTTPAQVPPATG